MSDQLSRYHSMAAALLCLVLAACGCSRDRATPSPSPQIPSVVQTALTAQDLSSILAILLSEDTPLVNLQHTPGTEIQVALPPVSGELPKTIGAVTLLPVDKSKPGLVLEIELLSASPDEARIRADVAFFDPEQGFALDGAEWRELIFRRGANGWRLHKALDGAIK
jgi:hypothetical protein